MDERTYARYMSDIAYFSSKLESDPDSKYFIPLCLAYNKMGKYDETVALCKGGVERFPNDCHSKVLLAEAYVYTGSSEAARDLLFEVIPEDPDNYKALKLLGMIYRNMEMPDEAVKYFRGAYFRSPEDPDLAGIIEELGGTVDPSVILEERKRVVENDAVQDDEETKTYFEIDQKIKNAESMMAELVSDSFVLKPPEGVADSLSDALVSDDDLNKLLEETGVAEKDSGETPFLESGVSHNPSGGVADSLSDALVSDDDLNKLLEETGAEEKDSSDTSFLPGDSEIDEASSVSGNSDPFALNTAGNAAAVPEDLSVADAHAKTGKDSEGDFSHSSNDSEEAAQNVAVASGRRPDETGLREVQTEDLAGHGAASADTIFERSLSDSGDFTEKADGTRISEVSREPESGAEPFSHITGDSAGVFDEATSNTSDSGKSRTDDKGDPASALVRALSGESIFSDDTDSDLNDGLTRGKNGFDSESDAGLAAVPSPVPADEIKNSASDEEDPSYTHDSRGTDFSSGLPEERNIFSIEDMVGEDISEPYEQNVSSVALSVGDRPGSPARGEEAPFFQSGIFEEIMGEAESPSDMPAAGSDVDRDGGLKALLRLNRENSETRKENREKSIKKLERRLEKIKNRNRR